MHTTKHICLVLLMASVAISARAGIAFVYNNTTGYYAVLGSDPGPGYNVGGTAVAYLWTWDTAEELNDSYAIFNAIDADGGLTGEIDGQAITDIIAASFSAQSGFSVLAPIASGRLAFHDANGFIAPGLWTSSSGIILAAPDPTHGSTSDDFILQVVPEPSTWAAIVGSLSLALAAWRRRVKK